MRRTPERNAELKRRRENRKLWDERSRKGQCWNCGKSDWVEAIDNVGAPYKGCANCIIGVPGLPAATENPHA